MTSFVHVSFPTEHGGVARFERAALAIKEMGSKFNGARGAATLLLAAIVAALLVVANQVVDTWTDGHLLAGWIVLWTIAFAALALLARPARKAVAAVKARWDAEAGNRRQANEDRKLWAVALVDARVMADLSRAMSAEGVAPDLRRYR